MPGVAEHHRHIVLCVDVSRDDDRDPQRRAGQASSVVPQDVGVAAVGTADEKQEIRQDPVDRSDLRVAEPTGRHVHDLGSGAEADPMAGLGSDLPLVPDHRHP